MGVVSTPHLSELVQEFDALLRPRLTIRWFQTDACPGGEKNQENKEKEFSSSSSSSSSSFSVFLLSPLEKSPSAGLKPRLCHRGFSGSWAASVVGFSQEVSVNRRKEQDLYNKYTLD